MTRQQAIESVVAVWLSHDQEFCCNRGERNQSRAELHEALKALGVSKSELEPELQTLKEN